ncbi:fibronectin type III domain-containing protein [Plantactinospora sp. DSM 117369]
MSPELSNHSGLPVMAALAGGGRPRVSARRALTVLTATLTMLVPYAAVAQADPPPAGGLSAAQLNEAFNTYGDTSGRWNGGDSTASVRLPDGRTVWLFSDTFVGPVNADGSRPDWQPMIHNSMVVQDGAELVETRTGGTAEEPLSLVGSGTDVIPGEIGHWVADGTVEGSTLQVLYNRYQRTGSHSLDVRITGTALASFDLPALTLRSLTPLPLADRIAWGSAILEDGATTYIYGASLLNDAGPVKSVYLAKVAAGQLAGPWQFWTGTGWSSQESEAARLMGGTSTAFGVQRIGDQYVMVTVDGNLVFNSEVVAYTATSPTGPFTGPIHLFRAPEPQPGREIIVYDARFHPELARSGKLLVSYNVNSLADADNRADARLYRPRFVEVDWPRPTPEPAMLPPTPAGLTGTADQERRARLSWTASAGATAYRIYRRDVSFGQSHPVRLPQDLVGTSFTGEGLEDNHVYEFSVAAVNANGESTRSGPVTVTGRAGPPEQGSFQTAPGGTAVTGSYLVELRDNAAAGEHGIGAIAARLVGRYGGALGHVYSAVLGGFSVSGMTDAQARQLATDPAVEFVEETRTGTIDSGGVQEDAPWGLARISGNVDGRYVYPGTGTGVTIYVVDNGVRHSHTDFGGRASLGKSFLANPANPDCSRHGTHVAGTAAGSEFGVAKDARIVSVQITCGDTVDATYITAGLDWVAKHAQRPAVANLSLSMAATGTDSDRVRAAVEGLVGSGVTVVAAAGNSNADACGRVPADAPSAITVGATDTGDERWVEGQGGSNHGTCVDIFAPGADIYSASSAADDAAEALSGTSMAAPHVAGAAALLLEAHPTYGPEQVAAALVGQAEEGVVGNPGEGSPNLLLRVAPPLDEAPTGLTATPADDGTIGLAWQPVDSEGLRYRVKQRDVTAGQPEFKAWDTDVYTGTSAVASGLIPGHAYEFTVAAVNSMAIGPDSDIVSATSTVAPPPAPANLTATAQGNGTIKLTWDEAQPDAWYWMYQRDVTLGETEFTKLPLPITACCQMEAGYLTHGHTYEYKVSATNRGGEGPASAPASATASFDAPAPPTNLRVTPGDGQVLLTWDPSATEDVWYQVHQRDATENEEWRPWAVPTSECCTANGLYLANGHEYEFRVTALRGAESVPSNVVRARPMPPLPGQPTNLSLEPLDTGEIKLTWDAPGPNVYYWVYWRDVTAGETAFRKSEVPTDQTEATWQYLANTHVYEFKVSAENIAGEGPASTPVQARSQVALPGAPTNLRAFPSGSLQIRLTWDAPGPNLYYWVYWRDVTAGETTFRRSEVPTDQTEATWQYLTNTHVYEFKVSAENVAGEGPASAPAQAPAIGIAPQPPSNLKATPGDGIVRLTWTASPTSGVGYMVYYRNVSENQSWKKLPYPLDDCCTITMEYLNNGDRYEFKVAATSAAGESDPSNVVSATPLPPFPQPPTNLRATAGDGQVRLAWTASSTPRVWYLIEYRKAGGSWIRLKYPFDGCCTFDVNLLNNGTTYEFRVRANNAAGDSEPSNVASARPLPPFPQPPSNLSASNAGDGMVKLTWSKSPTPNVWYLIEYRKAGGSWTRLPYPLDSCCSFTQKYLISGTTYEFRVRATNLAGDSSPSNVDSARPMPPFPKPPSNLRATAGDGQVKLTWSASPTPNVYYYIYQRNATLNGWWERLPYPISGTSLTAGYLANGHYYDFKVTAVNLSGESDRTNIVTALPRWASGTSRSASVTSSWVTSNDGRSWVQRYDVTGTVQGVREGDYLRVNGGWRTNNGKTLLDGIFWYLIIDCTEGYTVAHDTLAYETGGATGGALTFRYRMNPQRMYRVTVWGAGSVTYSGGIYGRFSRYSPAGIYPFIAETPCF